MANGVEQYLNLQVCQQVASDVVNRKINEDCAADLTRIIGNYMQQIAIIKSTANLSNFTENMGKPTLLINVNKTTLKCSSDDDDDDSDDDDDGDGDDDDDDVGQEQILEEASVATDNLVEDEIQKTLREPINHDIFDYFVKLTRENFADHSSGNVTDDNCAGPIWSKGSEKTATFAPNWTCAIVIGYISR